MGIINCTPDSFYSESRQQNIKQAVETGIRMAEEGADFLDVGGESSRPGAEQVPLEVEMDRVIPVIKELSKEIDIPISVDTYKAGVAQKAIEFGARIVNDISALTFDENMVRVVAEHSVPIILMHMQGKPCNMQVAPHYNNLISDISDFFDERISFAKQNGINIEKIILDPGIGFGKNLEDNYELLNKLDYFKKFNCPLLIGVSRKSFIFKVLELIPEESLEGTIAANTIAIMHGANILRVHDVKAAKQAAQITDYFINTTREVNK